VILAVSLGESVKLIGKGLTSGKAYDPILSPAQIATLDISPEHEPFVGDPSNFRHGGLVQRAVNS
jgi:hypothetical protein